MLDYLREIALKYARDDVSKNREMIYRADFENLLKQIFDADGKVTQISHDSLFDNGNRPDFIISKNNIPRLYIEAKDIGVNLDKIEKSDQMSRYFGYDNLVLTDYLEFRFYRNGLPYGQPIKLAEIDQKNRQLTPLPQNFELLSRTLQDFASSHKEPIKSGTHLAKIMGGKAQRIRDNVLAMIADPANNQRGELIKLQLAIKDSLVSSLSDPEFADMYAQTLVYGLFAARYDDPTQDNFSRAEARDLVPKTNPFLRSFFDHIAGSSFPQRLGVIVDELCEVFSHSDVAKILHDFYGQEKDNKDPIIHFYEDFLKEYDPAKKMEMGVFYTPRPVVQFIVRAVDELLKTEFGLTKGLADNSKIQVSRTLEQAQSIKNIKQIVKANNHKEYYEEFHKVQILDIATGTGTFLNEVIEYLYDSQFKSKGQDGRWPAYAQTELLPRLHGFELMMASYTIAHLKLGMTLHDTGASQAQERLGVYLTNTLDQPISQDTHGSLFGFMDSIAEESRLASKVKTDYPIMCVIGNPPYSGISQNKQYTGNNAYKVEPGGQQKLQERKHWLDDDYVKFIRFAESLIAKNGEGIMGLITAHGYIDNPTFRGMRWHLRKTFDSIYVLDLHGNSNKKETAPDGGKDENVFDIKTGVSIILGIKKKSNNTEDQKFPSRGVDSQSEDGVGQSPNIHSGPNKPLAQIYKADFYGPRKTKLNQLESSELSTIEWIKLPENASKWVQEGEGKSEYHKGFAVDKLFSANSTGVVTARDSLVIDENKLELKRRMELFVNSEYSDNEIRLKFFGNKKDGKYLAGDSRGWKLGEARKLVREQDISDQIQSIAYRPFDSRYIYYSPSMVDWGRWDLMKHFINHDNVALCVPKLSKNDWGALCTKYITGHKIVSAYDSNTIFPLYLYQDDGVKVPNLDRQIIQQIHDKSELILDWDAPFRVSLHPERTSLNPQSDHYTPTDLLDYIYASLHSPSYREKYQEFLKSDFPRVPYPASKEEFWRLVSLGRRLRELHLMTSPEVEEYITTYPVSGDNLVDKIGFVVDSGVGSNPIAGSTPAVPATPQEGNLGRVFINSTQYFGGVPLVAWNFYIGGYQPAQKYLKDRKNRPLTSDELDHYQRIIKILTETATIMSEIG